MGIGCISAAERPVQAHWAATLASEAAAGNGAVDRTALAVQISGRSLLAGTGTQLMPQARRLTSNTAILLANNVGSAGLAFLISVFIGRGLGAEGLGQYAFIMAWVSPLVALADFGMGSLFTRHLAPRR